MFRTKADNSAHTLSSPELIRRTVIPEIAKPNHAATAEEETLNERHPSETVEETSVNPKFLIAKIIEEKNVEGPSTPQRS